MPDTQTHLMGSIEEMQTFANSLLQACKKAEEGDMQHVRQTFEQASAKGPWRLLMTVRGKENEETSA